MITLYKNYTYYFESSIIDIDGDFAYGSGITMDYEIIKSSDESLIDSGSMAQVGNIYKVPYTFTQTGEYRIEYTTPLGYSNGMEEILVLEESQSPEIIVEKLNRILGLSQENYRVLNPVYDRFHNLVSSIIKIYPTSADVDADTNATASYQLTATYNKTLMSSYKVNLLP